MRKKALRLTDVQKIEEIGNSSSRSCKTSNLSAKELIMNSINNGEIDAKVIMSEWFKTVKTDVFISHSGADRNKVSKLANYLRELGYNAFVDSEFWGNIYELIEAEFDRIRSNSNTLTTENAKKVCADFYMLLSMQLVKTIESIPLFLFVDSANSRSSKISGNTNSPWIYLELETAERVFPHQIQKAYASVYDSVSFPTNINWMREITVASLIREFPSKS
jgi:hypothetical protein